MVLMNLIILIFEVLYYSLFMYYARKEGKFWRYLLLFILITVIGVFIGTSNLPSYLILILLIIYGLKYIVRLKISLYDMLVIVFMLLLKVLLELIFAGIFSIFTSNYYILAFTTSLIKVSTILIIKDIMYAYYFQFKIIWDNNNFYIRYIFTMLIYLFVMLSMIFLIVLPFIRNILF